MSTRLAAALVDQIAADLSGNPKAWILIDGVLPEVAGEIVAAWDAGLPELFVAGPDDRDFGDHALGDSPATRLRNAGPMCLVVCEGIRLSDNQSVKAFERYSPDDLVRSDAGLTRLAAASQDVSDADGFDEVQNALLDPKLERLPSPLAVARFFDSLAAGRTAAEALPDVGGFTDQPGDQFTSGRVLENLNLAASRSSAERLRPTSLSEIRARAQRNLDGDALSPDEIVDHLRRHASSLLRKLSYDQAQAVLEDPPPASLPDEVRQSLKAFVQANPELAEAAEAVEPAAARLDEPSESNGAAADLLNFDAEHHEDPLLPAVRKRLKALRREKAIKSDSLEEGLIRAVEGLASPLKAIELKEPAGPEGVSTEAHARNALSIAAAHARLAPLLGLLEHKEVKVAAELLDDPTALLKGAARVIDKPAASTPRKVVLVVRGESRGDASQVGWTPSAEDLALLMTSVQLTEDPAALTLQSGTEEKGGLATSATVSVTPPQDAVRLAGRLQEAAADIARVGFEPDVLREWTEFWSDEVEAAWKAGKSEPGFLDALAHTGCIREPSGSITLSQLAPLKSEWIAARSEAWLELLDLALKSNRGEAPREEGDALAAPVLQTARALASATAAQYPGFVMSSEMDRPLVSTADGTVLASFGAESAAEDVAPPSISSLEGAMRKFIDLYPEAAENFRCVAWRDGASDLVLRSLLSLMNRFSAVARAELVCIEGNPQPETLRLVDEWARGEEQGRLTLRFAGSLEKWKPAEGPEFHMAVVEGVTKDPIRLRANMETVPAPESDDDVLFTPKTWVRPGSSHMLMTPPRVSKAGRAWYGLMTAIDESWPQKDGPMRVAEIRTDLATSNQGLSKLHAIAQWVTTLDRFANRESLTHAVGPDVAILHQERRASGSVVEGMVISQRVGASADRAIERSLRRAALADETVGPDLAQDLRRAATRGYGILALRAATTGSGINELIGHVAGFSRLTTTATPWPLPAGCRVLLLSLDEYADWFGQSRRADMLALALSPDEGGVHAANVEVKSVRDETSAAGAMSEAKEQLRKTLVDSRFAAYPGKSLFSRLWLNRICEAAVAVARENGMKLDERDLAALDRFRRGEGVLEWAGIGMVFAPGAQDRTTHTMIPIMRDRVPIALSTIDLTLDLLRDSTRSDGTNLRTVETGRSALRSPVKTRAVTSRGSDVQVHEQAPPRHDETHPDREAESGEDSTPESPEESEETAEQMPTVHPRLGTDSISGEQVEWRVTGPASLSNGHMEVYGTSGAGKTQFIMSLLMQLQGMGADFGVCDFKNDYAGTFPETSGADFFDLWQEPLPFNPLAIDNPSRRSLQGLIIELRDTVEIAARPYARLGHRQLGKLQEAFEAAFENARQAGSVPTLSDVDALLDEDLSGVIGDLTGTELFGSGPPLGNLIDENAIFGLNHIPGTGLTTTLAAGFILSALYLKLLEMPQVSNTVSYVAVIDEAHRVANFHSVARMVRELRSKGLAVILATQKPGDLPDEASTNAQTKVFMRLPDAQSAKAAAKALDPSDKELPDQIRELDDGQAFVAIAGASPRLVDLRQHWRDD
jgi:hypothetical protein